MKAGNLPNMIVIGAQKCGTTSLHYYLGLHPRIIMSREKETNFFIAERHWSKGVDWYRSQFTGDADVFGEASPNYTNYDHFRGVAVRMHSVVPEARLIYVLRDPVERIVSQYVHYCDMGLEHRSIDVALADLRTFRYVQLSSYFTQLSQYLRFFPRDRILIVIAEEMRRSPEQQMKQIFTFLNVDASFSTAKFSRIQHRSIYKRRKTAVGIWLEKSPLGQLIRCLPPELRWHVMKIVYFPLSRRIERPVLSDELRSQVVSRLRDDVDRLSEFLQRDFEDWHV